MKETADDMITDRWSKLLIILLVCFIASTCTHAPISETSDVKTHSILNEVSKPRVLIVYKSKYGSTRQYAEWIHKQIPSDLVDAEKGDKAEFSHYDVIVFGGYVRMGRIVIAPLIVEAWNAIKEKKVVLFLVSGTPPQHPNIQKIFNKSLPDEIRKEIKYFSLSGRIVSRDLSFFDKLLMAIGRMIEKDETLNKFMGEDFNEVKPENLLPVMEHIKTISP
jgi:menaquinone-dependent protoporphyrinogen IX oxidase